MREYVLTEKELTIIKRFLGNGERLEGFAVLLSRCKRGPPKLENQLAKNLFKK